MKNLIILTMLTAALIIGCEDRSQDQLIDQMTEEAQQADIPVTREQIEQMAKASRENGTEPLCDFTPFLAALKNNDPQNAFTFLSDDLKTLWPENKFTADITQLRQQIGSDWQPSLMEFMNYPQNDLPVCTAQYQLTSDFQYTIKMMALPADSDSDLQILHVNLIRPYAGPDAPAFRDTAAKFLSAVDELDLKKARQLMADQYKDQLQLSNLQSFKDALYSETEKQKQYEKILGPIQITTSDGRTFFRILADSQIHPFMKLEILMQKPADQINIAGLKLKGRIKMN
ncbi:hypothetical protein STSP2_01291 [Anaerohalosphaera lusitana]|uniref:Lipoprotein n=1 Tax=Anaerohalosphaera lusitana TaxID=1936003 RepID=A0A1U9NKU6_9BACT|nr:hypothetical protein [Anaerohalosphaera lusitana]AQT68136.1 hypothetical protein STSP2_01291 [Anaerohalosphaera lusitana]